MTRKSGMRAWPPLWTNARNDEVDKPRGELGILREVEQNKLVKEAVFLWIDHEGARYFGGMVFDDASFCRAIFTFLKSQIGVPIQEIGDSDVSFLL